MEKTKKLATFRMIVEEANKAGVTEVPMKTFEKFLDVLGQTTARNEILEEIIFEQTGWSVLELELEEIKKIRKHAEKLDDRERSEGLFDILKIMEVISDIERRK